jgi:PIN domain nuclease of toxin-antitoxin system
MKLLLDTAIAETLPLLHKDPFDRLLLAQARTEGMQLLTVDYELPMPV